MLIHSTDPSLKAGMHRSWKPCDRGCSQVPQQAAKSKRNQEVAGTLSIDAPGLRLSAGDQDSQPGVDGTLTPATVVNHPPKLNILGNEILSWCPQITLQEHKDVAIPCTKSDLHPSLLMVALRAPGHGHIFLFLCCILRAGTHAP